MILVLTSLKKLVDLIRSDMAEIVHSRATLKMFLRDLLGYAGQGLKPRPFPAGVLDVSIAELAMERSWKLNSSAVQVLAGGFARTR